MASNTNKPDKDVPDYCQVLQFKDSNGQVKEMLFPKGLDLDRPKRPRTTFSESQLGVLETEFSRNQYLVGKERTRLAKELQLSETQIKVWFQNRRTKSKRDKPASKTDEISPMKSPSASCLKTDINGIPLLSPPNAMEFTSANSQLHNSQMLNAYGKLLATVMTSPYPGLPYLNCANFPMNSFTYITPTSNCQSETSTGESTQIKIG